MKTYPLLLMLTALFCSCKHHSNVVNDGVNIAFTDSGHGDTTLLFVHGWCINKSYWKAETDFFQDRYRVIAVDLPPSGASGNNRTDWSVEAYGKDLSAVIKQLDLKNVILIGHSMSGQIIVETAKQNKDHVIGLIGVDNFKGVESTPADDSAGAAFYKDARLHYQQTVIPYVSQYLFSATTDTLSKQRVIHDIAGADSLTAITILQTGDRYPGLANLAALGRKIYLINSDYTPTDTTGLRRKGIDFTLLSIHGTGHYPMIEKPAAFNALLAQAIDQIGIGKH